MKISTINYFIGDAFRSLKRNKAISFAAIITVFITFLVLGIFSLVAKNSSLVIAGVESKVELKVYLKDDISFINKREIEVKIREQEGVKDIETESKEEAFQKFEESMSESQGILEGYTLSNNPFPESYIVKLESPSYAESIKSAIEGLEGIDSISNQQELINTVENAVNVIRIIGAVLFVILISISVFLIMNTTKLAVYARRREVGIMKLVGATDWFIRMPFIIEGMVIALIGSVLSILSAFILYKLAFGFIVSKMLMGELISPMYVITGLSWKFAIGSIIIGGFASFASLRKFLVV